MWAGTGKWSERTFAVVDFSVLVYGDGAECVDEAFIFTELTVGDLSYRNHAHLNDCRVLEALTRVEIRRSCPRLHSLFLNDERFPR